MAEDLAVLDNISNGRVEYAPGLGYLQWEEHDSVNIKKMDLETFKKSGGLKVFTPGQAFDYIRAQIKMAPIEAFCMQIPAGYPLSKMLGHTELFAKKIMPAFQ